MFNNIDNESNIAVHMIICLWHRTNSIMKDKIEQLFSFNFLRFGLTVLISVSHKAWYPESKVKKIRQKRHSNPHNIRSLWLHDTEEYVMGVMGDRGQLQQLPLQSLSPEYPAQHNYSSNICKSSKKR
jgi:diphthamide biosynthesis methyltransferase